MQAASKLLMIRPIAFGFNEETAINNSFQKQSADWHTNEKAQHEFDQFVALLKSNNIDVMVIQDKPIPYTPDSIFPNNWISTHSDGQIVLYPMFAPNRRSERAKGVVDELKTQFTIYSKVDLTGYEKEGKFLEGTGSMILDRMHQKAYACISPRTDADVLSDCCAMLDYKGILFHGFDRKGAAIYHTNVMMSIGENYAIIALETITDPGERQIVVQNLKADGKEIIEISLEQMEQFAGNALQVRDREGHPFLIMSSSAFNSLTTVQIETIQQYNPILHTSLTTIEQNGGGSARCMIAELFLQPHHATPSTS